MEEPELDGVVSDGGDGPDPGHGEHGDGDGEQDDVDAAEDEEVEEPEAAAVHVAAVRVLVAVAAGNHGEAVLNVLKLGNLVEKLKLRFEIVKLDTGRGRKFDSSDFHLLIVFFCAALF